MTTRPCHGFVVIVDDEEDSRELLKELLEARGYQVATAEDGVDALDVMSRVPQICLVILDLLMPRMGGIELLEHLAKDPGRRSFPIWVATSAPDRVPVGVPCLPKPIDVMRLISIVEKHCMSNAISA